MAFRFLFSFLLLSSSIAFGSVCHNYQELLSPSHLNLGVNLQTKNPRIARAMEKALNHWTKILDMDWHQDQTSTCAIAIVESNLPSTDGLIDDAMADDPISTTFEGLIQFNQNSSMTDRELELTSVHELGHLFGLDHNPNQGSVMYKEDFIGDERLDVFDIYNLQKLHRLRVPMPIDIHIDY